MTSTLSGTQLILNGGNATLDASSASTLDFQGGTGDCVLTGVDNFTFSGEINTGTILGGHAMSFRGERGTTISSPEVYSMGNGNTAVVGPLMPQAGQVIGFSIISDSSSTATINLVGSISGTLLTLTLSASTEDSTTTPASFAADEQLYAQVASGTVQPDSRVFWTIIFD